MAAPTVPDIAQGNEAFSIAMRAFHTWEAGELYQAVNDFINSRLLPTNTTSTTSNSITAGNKTFTVELGKGFLPGQFLVAANTAAPANYIQGQCISYNSGTGALVMSNITSSGTGTFTAWTITQSLSGSGATLGANSYSGSQTLAVNTALRTSISTLASSATPDIWTNQSNKINYTGVVPATGFAAAPQAGMSVTLICAAAAPFVAGANMLIDGYASGQTYTAAADDVIEVYAKSTTQFKLKPSRYDGRALTFDSSNKLQPIDASVATNALTLALNPTSLDFRSPTLSSGAVFQRIIASAISMIVPSGAKLGTINGVMSRLVLLAIDNAGTVELAVSNIASGINLDETTLISTNPIAQTCTFTGAIAVTTGILTLSATGTGTFAIGQALSGTNVASGTVVQSLLSGTLGAVGSTYQTNQFTAAASTAMTGVAGIGIYSTTARTNLPFKVVGYIESTQATAGTWVTAPSTIQGEGGQALSAMSSLGYSQTWVDVLASRVSGTTYYNTTGKPITVCVYATTGATVGSGTLNANVNGQNIMSSIVYSAGAGFRPAITLIVPPSSSYSYAYTSSAGGSITSWNELR